MIIFCDLNFGRPDSERYTKNRLNLYNQIGSLLKKLRGIVKDREVPVSQGQGPGNSGRKERVWKLDEENFVNRNSPHAVILSRSFLVSKLLGTHLGGFFS